jgi:hypothetical protein
MEEDMNEEDRPEKTIREMLQSIEEQNKALIETKETKEFKIPFFSRVSNMKAKKGFATVIIIRHNGVLDFKKIKIEDGVVKLDGFPRVSTIDYKLTHKGKPVFIFPEWSIKPFSPVENYEESIKEKMNMVGRRTILSKLEGEKISLKTPLGSKGWIILIIALVAAGYYFIKGGAF